MGNTLSSNKTNSNHIWTHIHIKKNIVQTTKVTKQSTILANRSDCLSWPIMALALLYIGKILPHIRFTITNRRIISTSWLLCWKSPNTSLDRSWAWAASLTSLLCSLGSTAPPPPPSGPGWHLRGLTSESSREMEREEMRGEDRCSFPAQRIIVPVVIITSSHWARPACQPLCGGRWCTVTETLPVIACLLWTSCCS